MAERNPCSWLQGGSHTAENDRNLIAFLINAGGILLSTDLAVTAPGGTMTVSVAAGQAFVKGSRTLQGVYHCINDAAVSKTIAASDPTNARYDRIVAEVKDAAYSGATNAWQINVYQGTPSGSPVEPTIPADCIELARITVPATATTINSGNILDRRVQVDSAFAARGQGLAANVGSAGRKGRFYWKTDSGLLTFDDGTALHDFAPASSTGLLGFCQYNPATSVDKSRSSTTFTALDTANLRATFVAPASGVVLVEFGAWGSNLSASTNGPNLGVLDGSTVKAVSGYQGSSATGSLFGPITGTQRVTGLTPGATYNWDLAAASSSAGVTVDVTYGQGYAGGNGGDAHGPAYLFITAA